VLQILGQKAAGVGLKGSHSC